MENVKNLTDNAQTDINKELKNTLKDKMDSEFMIVGKIPHQFKIEKGSIVQLKNDDDWKNYVCVVQYILEGVAYLFSPAKQEYGLYKLGIWNCENVIPYEYN